MSPHFKSRKTAVSQALNTAMIFLYWEIGETICLDILNHAKADYGRGIMFTQSVLRTKEKGHVLDQHDLYQKLLPNSFLSNFFE